MVVLFYTYEISKINGKIVTPSAGQEVVKLAHLCPRDNGVNGHSTF